MAMDEKITDEHKVQCAFASKIRSFKPEEPMTSGKQTRGFRQGLAGKEAPAADISPEMG